MNRLYFGILATTITTIILISWIIDAIASEKYSDAMPKEIETYVKITKGFLKEIDNQDIEAVKKKLLRIRELYSLDLSIQSTSSISLPSELSAELNSNGTLVLEQSDSILVIAQLQNQENSLLALNIPETISDNRIFDFALTLLLYLSISLFLIVCLAPLTSRLSTLTKMTQRFGSGDLKARISLVAWSYIPSLEKSFNTMAEKIETLVADNKFLAGSISHDLRTPLASIRFGLEAIKEAQNASKQRVYFIRVDNDITSMEEMLEKFLEYASMERFEHALNMKKLSLNALLETSVRAVIPLISRTKNINIFSTKPDISISGDQQWLNRALTNVIHNAGNHAENCVEIESIITFNNFLEILIHDDGFGVKPENKYSIFEPFFTGNTSRTRGKSGFGLGLSITKKVIEWHKGTIEVSQSPKLKGALFLIKLPISVASTMER